MSEIRTVKKNQHSEEDYEVYSDNEHEGYFDSKDEEDRENEYFEETAKIMRKELLTYIEDKSVTVGEFMTVESMEKYLNYRLSK